MPLFKKSFAPSAEGKFLRYKAARRRLCELDLSQIHTDYESGLVSVVLPVYNGEKYLEEAIASVLGQAYRHLELIAVDDGSTDSTPKILERFAAEDKRMRVITQENKKLPAALNRGFKEARGEFLTWISADNTMLPECLAVLVDELEQNPQLSMVYGNMRLIDEKGMLLRWHGWFEQPLASGNVRLPHQTDRLNIVANNTIGAAFLYRASAAAVAGGYSVHKFGTEDYDYWMRLNELGEIAHTADDRPLVLYRMHSDSLTAQDAELGITANRYKLMLLDDFRRDFLLSAIPTLLYGKKDSLKQMLTRRGHIILTDLEHDTYAMAGVYCDNDIKPAQEVYAQIVPKGSGYQCRLCGGGEESEVWCADICNLADVLDCGLRSRLLSYLEGVIERQGPFDKKISVAVCTDGRAKTLSECLNAICEQMDGDSELLVVDNAAQNPRCHIIYETIKNTYPDLSIRYINAPVGGLSYARNAAVWAAHGEVILYLDDDSIAQENLLKEVADCFVAHPKAGVVGGQIFLQVPKKVPKRLLKHGRGLWSEFLISGDEYKVAKTPAEFPYGACFAVRTQALRQLGGFRTRYGRVGEDYAGGEELQVCHEMATLGLKVGLCPSAKVLHKVDRSRFTAEHVRRTKRAAEETQRKLKEDLY